MYIEKHGNRYRVNVSEHGRIVKKTFATLEEATAFKEAHDRRVRWSRRPGIIERDKHHITLTPAPPAIQYLMFEYLWDDGAGAWHWSASRHCWGEVVR